jgi:ubiquinone/menaquinone biosynthesis C-methylase UbiE
MSADEMMRYYTRVHRDALDHDRRDSLAAVVGPDAGAWVNRFKDFAHRLGMRRAFRTLEHTWGSLGGRAVLDLGCGRGRWCKQYAARGATVTGSDISRDVIQVLREEMPQHRFIADDVAALIFPDESFDVVNSVTVLQHMPDWKQRIVLAQSARWVKRGGYLVLFENILGFNAPHVFPHLTQEWISMVEATGLQCSGHWGSNFEALFKLYGNTLHLLQRNSPSGRALPLASPGPAPRRGRLKETAASALAIASFPVESLCHLVPIAKPSHSVMIFKKAVDVSAAVPTTAGSGR